MLNAKNIANIFILFLVLSSPLFAGSKWDGPAHFPSQIVGAALIYPNDALTLAQDGNLYEVDLKDGSTAIAYSLPSKTSVAPAKCADYAIIGSDSGRIYAYSPDEKRIVWQYPALAQTGLLGAEPKDMQAAGELKDISCSEQRVYAVFEKILVAFDERNGAQVFSKDLENARSSFSNSNGVYVSAADKLYYFTKDGVNKWAVQPGYMFKATPYANEETGLLYVAGTNNMMMAFDAYSGELRWTFPLKGWAMSTPISDGSTLVFGSNEGKIYGLDAHRGTLLWEVDAGGPVWGGGAIVQKGAAGLALFGTNNNSLVGIDMLEGKLAFDYQIGAMAQEPAVSQDGRLALVAGRDNSLWAINTYPICTLDYPRTNQIIPSEIMLSGRAFSFNGIKNVQVLINGQELPIITMNGKNEFSFALDLSSQPIDVVSMQCIAEDNGGLFETDALGYKAEPILSLGAPKLEMSLVPTPQNVQPSGQFLLYMRNSRGMDMQDVLVQYLGNNMTVSSPAKLDAPEKGGQYKIISRKAGYSPAEATLYVKEDLGIIPYVLLVVIIAIAVGGYFLVFARKRKAAAD